MSEPALSPQLAARLANLEKARAIPKEVRYRMTEKRLAACRRNLAKARAVSRDIRFRPTEKRLAANRANLRKARERATDKGATMRHGMSCRTLEGSVAGAGEMIEALRAFCRRFEALLRPQEEVETKLVRGLAQASWRRLRAFRVRARWERRKLAEVLRKFARRRIVAPVSPPASGGAEPAPALRSGNGPGQRLYNKKEPTAGVLRRLRLLRMTSKKEPTAQRRCRGYPAAPACSIMPT